MEFLLTTSFSGPWYPGFLADCDAVVGKGAGGVDRLVEHLEIHVGLAFPSDPAAIERTRTEVGPQIQLYARAVEAAGQLQFGESPFSPVIF